MKKTTTTSRAALAEAIEAAGSQRLLAEAISAKFPKDAPVTQTHVSYWLKRSKSGVPAVYCPVIERLYGVPASRLQPRVWLHSSLTNPSCSTKNKSPMKVTLPYPPSTNRNWRLGKDGQIYVAPWVKEYRTEVWACAHQAEIEQLDGLVSVTVTLHPPAPKNAEKLAEKNPRDWHLNVRCIDRDNALKVLLDALQGIAYADDKQVWDVRCTRGLPVTHGAIEVRIEPFVMVE